MGGPLGVDRAIADRTYLALTGGMFGASIANAELTVRCLQVSTPPATMFHLRFHEPRLPCMESGFLQTSGWRT